MRHSKKLHERLVECLLSYETVTQAAAQAGLSRQHVHRLLADKDFQTALRSAREQAFGLSMSRLCHLSGKAVTVLGDMLDGKDVSKGKFLAAKCVIEAASQAVIGDVEARFDEIERAIAQLDRSQP